MTVCIVAICGSGEAVVLATDAMITGEDLMIEYEFPVKKFRVLTDTCVVAAAGNAHVETDLLEAVRNAISNLKSPSRDTIVSTIEKSYQSLRKKAIEDELLRPRGFEGLREFHEMQQSLLEPIAKELQEAIDDFDLEIDVIVALVDENGAHIMEIEDPGTSTTWTELIFNAIGSGYKHAVTTMIIEDYRPSHTLPEALLSVYAGKKAAEKAPGVGHNVTHMCVVRSEGVTILSDEQVERIDQVYKSRSDAIRKLNEENMWHSKLNDLLD